MKTSNDIILDLAEEINDELTNRKVKTRDEVEIAFDIMLEDYCEEKEIY